MAHTHAYKSNHFQTPRNGYSLVLCVKRNVNRYRRAGWSRDLCVLPSGCLHMLGHATSQRQAEASYATMTNKYSLLNYTFHIQVRR